MAVDMNKNTVCTEEEDDYFKLLDSNKLKISRVDIVSQNGTTGEHYDNVNHPKHYTSHPSGIECIKVTEHFNFNLGNAIKYIWRAGLKNNTSEDLKKAEFYIKREIARIES